MEVLERCPKEAYWQYEVGLRSKASSDALDFGNRLHEHLETDDESVWDGYKEKGIKPRDYRTAPRGKRLVELYKKKYRPRDERDFRVVDREIAFELPYMWNNDRIWIVGRIDELLVHKETGQYWAKDFKTTSMYVNEENFFSAYYLGGQSEFYLWALEQMKGPDLVGGFIVDVFQVRSNIEESCITRRLFEAMDVKRSGFDDTIADYWHRKINKNWPMYTTHCRRYNTVCPFYDLCRFGANPANLAQFEQRK